METIIGILIIVVCVLLALVILVQNPKGGGLATGFSGANQFGGVQRTNEFLDKATWTLVIALMALSLVSAAVMKKDVITNGGTDSQMEELIGSEPVVPQGQPIETPTQPE